MAEHAGQWLYEEGMAIWGGLNFKKEDEKRGRSMLEASASSGFPLAVADCHYWGWNGTEKDFNMFVEIEQETNELGTVYVGCLPPLWLWHCSRRHQSSWMVRQIKCTEKQSCPWVAWVVVVKTNPKRSNCLKKVPGWDTVVQCTFLVHAAHMEEESPPMQPNHKSGWRKQLYKVVRHQQMLRTNLFFPPKRLQPWSFLCFGSVRLIV